MTQLGRQTAKLFQVRACVRTGGRACVRAGGRESLAPGMDGEPPRADKNLNTAKVSWMPAN